MRETGRVTTTVRSRSERWSILESLTHGGDGRWERGMHVYVRIAKNTRQLRGFCFEGEKCHICVTVGPSSLLERIGHAAFGPVRYGEDFYGSNGIGEISVPDSVRRLGGFAFYRCSHLRRVTFGPSSSLERIGYSCFAMSGIKEIAVPDSVRELRYGCFEGCWSLRRVTFGPSSSLERIGGCASWTVILMSLRCLFLCKRLAVERLLNAHCQGAFCAAMAAVSVRLAV